MPTKIVGRYETSSGDNATGGRSRTVGAGAVGCVIELTEALASTAAAQHAAVVLDQVLARAGVRREHVKGWVMHPGGRDVLLALREQLGLSDHDLRWSAAVLRDFGNLSSASVYFVLQAALGDSTPNGYWWMSSFGAGFSCYGKLLEVG